MEYPEITEKVIAAALRIHSAIGPGVLESVYQTCLQHELRKAGLAARSEVMLQFYTMVFGWILDTGLISSLKTC